MFKAFNVAKKILTFVFVIAAVAMMIFTIISATTLDRNNRKLFGFKMYKVLSDSMSATNFSAGDLIFIKEVNPSTLKVGDIVSYISTDTDNFGEVVTHKIRSLTTDANGDPGFITYGTTTNTDDKIIVTYPYILGQYKGRVPKAGYFFDFLQTTPGYIVCILLPFALLILMQGINSVNLFRKYKKEQNEALESERAKIETEREETKKMMAELLALKAQMTAGQTPSAQVAASPASVPAETPAEKSDNTEHAHVS